jgi:hypothetical protein
MCNRRCASVHLSETDSTCRLRQDRRARRATGRETLCRAQRRKAGEIGSRAGRCPCLPGTAPSVRALMSKSALMRTDDQIALATFQDLTEQLWADER